MSATDKEMAPKAHADAHRRRERIHGEYQIWLSQTKLSGKPADLVAGMKVFAMEMAREAVAAGAPLRISKADWEEFMRRFICQTRAQRFGPLDHTDAGEWKNQIDQLCTEYGWKWVEKPRPQIARAA